MSSDYLGNYLYGYVGKEYLGMPDGYLKSSAGLAQVISDKNIFKYGENLLKGNYGDNAGDAKSIQDGIDAYKRREK
ncbi:polymorphic toxin type 44 domain-containing protein [Streptococcus oricebi]|uniref:Bacterial toxin 44 domain-containing protein n=1 Tax=Streptococcus oricebi TaxID=1547447 RepID=A0ABS5B4S9_9STRE|nr:polymorphic toxin type 44 domain-containing protein [Streptococcus oricebi]MBP2623691.1 hypothetical protein [Streptococcus oricebi]